MSLHPRFMEAVAWLYPNEDHRKVILQDDNDGFGPRLVEWGLPGQPPTETEITKALEQKDNAVPVVKLVTPRQARLALLAAGLLSHVETIVKEEGGAVQITWEYATEINRDDPLIMQLASQLGLTENQIDSLFATAATL